MAAKDLLEAIQRPIAFAAKNGFARLGSVKGIEPLVESLCKEAEDTQAPGEVLDRLKALKPIFRDFDSLKINEKRQRIIEAAFLLGSSGLEEVVKGDYSVALARKAIHGLKTPLSDVKGIGQRLSERLQKKGLKTVEDMLYFQPIRYEDRRSLKTIRGLAPGQSGLTVAKVMASGEAHYGRRKVFEAIVSDDTGLLKLKWFNYRLRYMKTRFPVGSSVKIFGPVTVFNGQKEIIHPDCEAMDEAGVEATLDDQFKGITPVYSQIDNLRQKTIRRLVSGVIEGYAGLSISGVPRSVRDRLGLMPLPDAIKALHSPKDAASADGAKKAISFDDLFLLELGLAIRRERSRAEDGISFKGNSGRAHGLQEAFIEKLPYRLTGAQKRVVAEILSDMDSPMPMMRLIQGDVGSGKTVVSLLSALHAIEAGYQAAIMAPTEILAEQHFLTTRRFCESLGVRIALLTGKMPAKERKKALNGVSRGEVGILIGTHALIQGEVVFKRLGLAIIDEQHRFGVMQRAALKKKAEKGIAPDMLIMTATPIPRTLGMTIFGDLDVSTIDELPPGRTPVRTILLKEKDRGRVYDAIKKELKEGSQCYIVYPLVEGSEELCLKDAIRAEEELKNNAFRDFAVGLLHGRLKSDEKEAVMRAFKDKKIHVLVCTTVVEVGIDVPNATIMFIEHAERFGLAQLHQLRGRVGRGEKRSYCFLMTPWNAGEDSFRRLRVMEETQDGFRIAEEDLKIRGPGDFIGTRQAGFPEMRSAGALTDFTLLSDARRSAFQYLSENPGLKGEEALVINEVLRDRWAERLNLSEIG